jgi:hypothetical protein
MEAFIYISHLFLWPLFPQAGNTSSFHPATTPNGFPSSFTLHSHILRSCTHFPDLPLFLFHPCYRSNPQAIFSPWHVSCVRPNLYLRALFHTYSYTLQSRDLREQLFFISIQALVTARPVQYGYNRDIGYNIRGRLWSLWAKVLSSEKK